MKKCFEADAILAFAFGAPADLAVNLLLAKRAMQLSRQSCLAPAPIFTQRDIFLPGGPGIIAVTKSGERLSTLAMVSQFLEAAKARGWRNVIVLAAPPHVWRCVRDPLKLSAERKWRMKVVVDDWLHRLYVRRFWYSPNSKSAWTQSPFLWWPRELILRSMPFWLYKDVTLNGVMVIH